MGSHKVGAERAEYTHQIEDGDGEWIWMGQEQEMSVIFHNLTGRNFEGQPAVRHEQYLAQMRHMHVEAWPGREDPYAPGATIRMSTLAGEVLATHTFPAG